MLVFTLSGMALHICFCFGLNRFSSKTALPSGCTLQEPLELVIDQPKSDMVFSQFFSGLVGNAALFPFFSWIKVNAEQSHQAFLLIKLGPPSQFCPRTTSSFWPVVLFDHLNDISVQQLFFRVVVFSETENRGTLYVLLEIVWSKLSRNVPKEVHHEIFIECAIQSEVISFCF
jgi:hypothetical protein